jgi:hypothetical protein
MYSCSNITPYSPYENWYYKYEGLDATAATDSGYSNTDSSGNTIVDVSNISVKASNIYVNGKVSGLDIKSGDLSDNKIEKFSSYGNHSKKKLSNLINKNKFTKVEGFSGIFGSSIDSSEMIDIFRDSKSSTNCYGSGLVNSGGGLCLDEKQRILLTTRGGNAV